MSGHGEVIAASDGLEPIPLRFELMRDFTDQLQGRTVLATGIGDDESVALLLDVPLIDPMQPKPAALPQSAVLLARGLDVREVAAAARNALIQPLIDGGYVIASVMGDPGHAYPRHGSNAWRYDADGRQVQEFYVDDSAECLTSDANDEVWIGYCDDGVCTGSGDYANGICRFDTIGQLAWSWPRPVGEDTMEGVEDCHTLNVADESVWACSHWQDTYLIRIDANGNLHKWRAPGVDTARAVVIDGGRVLTVGRDKDQPSGRWLLWDIGEQSLDNPRPVAPVPFLPSKRSFYARGSRLYFEDEGRIYRGDIRGLACC